MSYDFEKVDFSKLSGRKERGYEGFIYAQPIRDYENSDIHKFEILTRFNVDFVKDPGVIERIFQELEKTGEIIDHDLDVMRRAHMALSYVRTLNGSDNLPEMAVNISPKTLSSPKFAAALLSMKEDDPFIMDKMIVEITERYDFDNEDIAFENCQLIKSTGLRIAQDDYPLGRCAAIHSKRIAPLVDIIKMEVGRIPSLKATARMAFDPERCLKVEERIETIAHEEGAIRRGAGKGQGFFYGRPMPIKSSLEALASA